MFILYLIFVPRLKSCTYTTAYPCIRKYPLTHQKKARQSIMSKVFSQSDVASHSKPNDIWIIINNDVFDVTKFQDTHPGGKKGMKASEVGQNVC